MPFPDGRADFRSDTVTRPTPEMRRAMAEAEVGDDVYGDDPTVNALEEEAAAAVDKSRAVFVPTGTMANQLAVMCQTRPGDEVLVPEDAHIANLERGWGPAHAGVGWRQLPGEGGIISPRQVETVMDLAGSLYPRVTMLAWENTHNLSGGRVVPIEVMEATSQAGRHRGLAIHLDGARVFNAEAATGVKAARFAAVADTVAFCFSKGLGAPIGSVLCGPADLVDEARYLRKRLGGGMRQVGVIAAAARVALRDRERLAEDHHLARYLGERLAAHFPGSVDPEAVATNMVMVAVGALPRPLAAIRADLEAVGVITSPALGDRWRLVTHRDVDATDVDRLVDNLG